MARRALLALRRRIQRPLRAQRGQAMIMMVIMLPMLVMFAGLVADTGIVYVTKARLQNTVDAAALAGAHQLPVPAAATTLACTYVDSNYVPGMTAVAGPGAPCPTNYASVDIQDSNTAIIVTSTRNVPTVFGSLLGKPSTDVTARAKVKIGSPSNPCIFPFFLKPSETGIPFSITAVQRGSAIDVGSGSTAVRDAMQLGACATPGGKVSLVPDEDVDLKPGASAQFGTGWEDRLAQVASSSCPEGDLNAHYRVEIAPGQYEVLPSLSPANCPRMVLMPVLPEPPGGGEYKGNEDNIPIEGYAGFWVRAFCAASNCAAGSLGTGSPALTKGDVWGYTIPMNVPSSTYTTYDPDFGSKVVVMAE